VVVASPVLGVPTRGTSLAPDYDAWDRVLQANVAEGVINGLQIRIVNYSGIAADADFSAFMDSLAALDNDTVQAASLEEQYALYLNAYNAFAIKLIVENPCKYNITNGTVGECLGPIQKIGDIEHAWGRNVSKIGGVDWGLGDISDHKLRLPPLGNHLIFGALNSGCTSCPDLPVQAFRPATVFAQLDAQMRSFLNDTSRGLYLNRSDLSLLVSKNFEFKMEDFGNASAIVEFVLSYMPADDQTFVSENYGDISLQFLDWDPSVNGQADCDCASSVYRPPILLCAARICEPVSQLQQPGHRSTPLVGARFERVGRHRRAFRGRSEARAKDGADAQDLDVAGFLQVAPDDAEL